MSSQPPPLHAVATRLDPAAVTENLCPVFQPFFDARLHITGHEALMRVVDANGSLLPLGDHVLRLEAAGLIANADIGMARLVRQVQDHVRLPVLSINASVYTLDNCLPEYIEAIRPLLDTTQRVIVEITETSAIIDAGRLRASVAQLQDSGFLVALDDAKLGHAYGHPGFIASSKPDVVKIDGLFFHQALDEPTKQYRLEQIVDAAHELGAIVIIEWIDSVARLEAAFRFGADWVQGFLFGQPQTLWPSTICTDPRTRPCNRPRCALPSDRSSVELQVAND